MLARDRVLAEARAAAALNHPNVCTVHAIDDSNGAPMIVMEYVAGETLAERIQCGALPPDAVAAIGRQIAAGLAAAHAAGVVHGDLKPANLMVTPSGTIKIMDFGLARRVSELDGRGKRSSGLDPPVPISAARPATWPRNRPVASRQRPQAMCLFLGLSSTNCLQGSLRYPEAISWKCSGGSSNSTRPSMSQGFPNRLQGFSANRWHANRRSDISRWPRLRNDWRDASTCSESEDLTLPHVQVFLYVHNAHPPTANENF